MSLSNPGLKVNKLRIRAKLSKRFKIILFYLIFLNSFFISQVKADLTINLIAVNASVDKAKEIEVKYDLPKELTLEDIVDSGVLKIDYDVDKGSYFAHGLSMFQPKESKTLSIKVKDVWKITEEEINLLKSQLDENLKLFKDKERIKEAEVAKDRIHQKLDYILAQQENYSENVDRRIEEYRAYAEILEGIKGDVFNLDYLPSEAKAIKEETAKTIKFVIEVKNPLEKEEKLVKHKHYLPKEIRAEHVIENAGFDIRYDEKTQRAYLTKEEKFNPGEVKKYVIVIKNIWYIPNSKIETIEEKAGVAMKEIAGSMYAASGQYLYDQIKRQAQLIKDSQAKEYPTQEYIGVYRVNLNRFEKLEEYLERLEQMLHIVRARKLEQIEKGKVKNILQRMKGLRGIAALSEALFKKGISVNETWRVIFGTLIFVGFFTSLNFFIWSKRSKVMGEEMGVKTGEQIKEVPKPGVEPGKAGT